MKIVGIESICCGKGVSTRTERQIKKDGYLYKCHGCWKPCDAYFVALIRRAK